MRSDTGCDGAWSLSLVFLSLSLSEHDLDHLYLKLITGKRSKVVKY